MMRLASKSFYCKQKVVKMTIVLSDNSVYSSFAAITNI